MEGGGGQALKMDGNWRAASGGGRSAVQKKGVVSTEIYDDILTAGGGGGGGKRYNSSHPAPGGAGGGDVGAAGESSAGEKSHVCGFGGTQTEGGNGGLGLSASNFPAGNKGVKYNGGSDMQFACGGGGGYYGGGSGSEMGGGGGGSSFVDSTLLLSGKQMVQGNKRLVAGNDSLPIALRNTIGNGGDAAPSTANSNGSDGQYGLVIITFT